MHQEPTEPRDKVNDNGNSDGATDSDNEIDQYTFHLCSNLGCIRVNFGWDSKKEICVNCYTFLAEESKHVCATCSINTEHDSKKYASRPTKDKTDIMCEKCFNTIGFCKKCASWETVLHEDDNASDVDDDDLQTLLDEYPNMRYAVLHMCYSCAEDYIKEYANEEYDGPVVCCGGSLHHRH
jgi:hypothetical protein